MVGTGLLLKVRTVFTFKLQLPSPWSSKSQILPLVLLTGCDGFGHWLVHLPMNYQISPSRVFPVTKCPDCFGWPVCICAWWIPIRRLMAPWPVQILSLSSPRSLLTGLTWNADTSSLMDGILITLMENRSIHPWWRQLLWWSDFSYPRDVLFQQNKKA